MGIIHVSPASLVLIYLPNLSTIPFWVGLTVRKPANKKKRKPTAINTILIIKITGSALTILITSMTIPAKKSRIPKMPIKIPFFINMKNY